MRALEKPVPREIGDVILQQDQPRLPARDIEAAQDFELVPLRVDGEKIDRRRRLRLDQDLVERSDRHLDHALGLRTGRHALAVKRRQRPGDMQRQRLSGMVRRRAGDGEDLAGARPAQLLGEVRLRLDQDAAPARLFEMPGLRAQLRLVGTDLDEVAIVAAGEERTDQCDLALIQGI